MVKKSKSKQIPSKRKPVRALSGSLPSVADWPEGRLHSVPGFRTAALHCGLKSIKSKPDMAFWVSEAPAVAAGVFTTNQICAAPVTLSRDHLSKTKGHVRAVLVNAGNANACTGEQGEKDALAMASAAARELKCPVAQVLVCSTGVIGRKLPMSKVKKGISRLGKQIRSHGPSADFAGAILTTDLVPKTAGARFEILGTPVCMTGATKGSGMIAPNMATTLGFIGTDAKISPVALQAALRKVSDETYNCITVDGDTSTNDTLLVMASGLAEHAPIARASGKAYALFLDALYRVCDDLARQIAADGEGATHTVTIYVGGTRTDRAARQIALTVGNSPLVKTAIAGRDPNWGRIMAAAGRSGVSFLPHESSLTVCGFELYRAGVPLDFDAETVSKAMEKREVSIVLLVGEGPGRARCYTCDLTKGYVEINAHYHT